MRVKIDPIDRWVDVTVSELLSPDERSRAVADFARGAFREAQDKNRAALGREPPFEQFVDGRRGAALETVKPDRGLIVFDFELTTDAVRWILAELVRRSPVGPAGGAGTYRDSHLVFADGREIDPAAPLPPADEWSITNTVVYARKIEIGVTRSGRPFVINAEHRLYDRVSHEAAARFSRFLKIGYTFRPLVGGATIRGRSKRTGMRYPTITIRPR